MGRRPQEWWRVEVMVQEQLIAVEKPQVTSVG